MIRYYWIILVNKYVLSDLLKLEMVLDFRIS